MAIGVNGAISTGSVLGFNCRDVFAAGFLNEQRMATTIDLGKNMCLLIHENLCRLMATGSTKVHLFSLPTQS